MIARTVPFIAQNGDLLGHHFYAALSAPTAEWPYAYCLSVYLPASPAVAPTIDSRHVSASDLDAALPCAEGHFLSAYLDAQQRQLAALAEARAFGLPKPDAAAGTPAAPTHIVTTVEAVSLTDDERPCYSSLH